MLRIYVCVTLLTLSMSHAGAQLFSIGEDERFSWETLEPIDDLNFRGESLTILGSLTGPDAQSLENVLEYFEVATGASIAYEGSDAFEQEIVSAVESGNPPDIAVFPQPGLAADLAAQGYLTPLGADFEAWMLDTYAAGESWLELSSYADETGRTQLFSLPYKVDLKSLVWYSSTAFEEAGYQVPESFEELLELSDEIAAERKDPWCIGLGSGEATGWPATDWVEDILLRTAEPQVYDRWVRHEIPFDDAAIVNAIELFGTFAKNRDWLHTKPAELPALDYRDAPVGLFDEPPQCYLHHQASFIPAFFPEDAELGTDVDFFYFPELASEDLGKPVLGAGTLWSITENGTAARALLEFLQTPLAHELWMAQSGFLTPHTGVNTQAYANDSLRGQGDILLSATTFRFDGSDLMPGAIGTGAFWQAMIDYVSTDMTAQEAAAQVEGVWKALE